MIEFFKSIYNELIVEVIVVIFVAILGFYFRRYVKKQQQRDAEQDRINKEREEAQRKKDEDQDRINKARELEQKRKDEEQDKKMQEWRAEFESKLKTYNMRIEYFEKQRLTAYQEIRKFSQKARDEARLIETPGLIEQHDNWAKKMFKYYEEIVELLHEHALLLEHFENYEYFHDFKNKFLNFCLIAQKLNKMKSDEHAILKREFDELSKSYENLILKIKFPSESFEPTTKSNQSNDN